MKHIFDENSLLDSISHEFLPFSVITYNGFKALYFLILKKFFVQNKSFCIKEFLIGKRRRENLKNIDFILKIDTYLLRKKIKIKFSESL
jgi:hypothetical protein